MKAFSLHISIHRTHDITRAGKEFVVPSANIIAIIPRQSARSDGFSLLYTTENSKATDGSKESHLLFEFFEADSIPDQFIQASGPSDHNDWLPRKSSAEPRVERQVIVSTGSGTGIAWSVWQSLVKPLFDRIGLRERLDYQLHFTASETSITELTQSTILPKANDGLSQSILLLSGDGGIVDIVNTLVAGQIKDNYKNPTISLLPLGTGNALANSSNINSDQTLGLSTMLRGSAKELPLFRVTFSPGARLLTNHGQKQEPLKGVYEGQLAAYGAVVCSWGLHATLVADSDTPEYRKFGAERFKMAAKESLYPSDGSLPHAYIGSIETIDYGKSEDDRRKLLRREHGYILATPVSQLEAGFTISPASKPLDGKLRLVEFGAMSGEEAMEIMGKAYNGGKHVEDSRVWYHEVEAVRINVREEDPRWRRVCLDGKIIQVEQDGWVEIRGPVEGVVDLVVKK